MKDLIRKIYSKGKINYLKILNEKKEIANYINEIKPINNFDKTKNEVKDEKIGNINLKYNKGDIKSETSLVNEISNNKNIENVNKKQQSTILNENSKFNETLASDYETPKKRKEGSTILNSEPFIRDESCDYTIKHEKNLFKYCDLKLQENKISKVKENSVLPKQRNIKHYDYILRKMGIINFEDENLYSTISERVVKNMKLYEYTKIYWKFIGCINLDDANNSIRVFDLKIFSRVFSQTYNNSTINFFIEKLLKDKFTYEKKNLGDSIIIILFSYLYSKKIKNSSNCIKLKEKIIKNSHSLERKVVDFDYFVTNDDIIDKLQLKLISSDVDFYKESLFLNYYYRKYLSKDKLNLDIFNDFQRRLNGNLEKIDKKQVLCFLKNIFLFNTVIYSISNEEQVVSFIYSFYTSKSVVNLRDNLMNLVYRFSELLIEKTPEYFEPIVHHNLKISEKKLKERFLYFKIKAVETFEEYKNLIIEHKESFNNIKTIYKEIFSLLSIVEYYKITLHSIQLCFNLLFFMIKELKKEFLINFKTDSLKNLNLFFIKVNEHRNLLIEDYKLLTKLNNENCTTLSSFILLIQKSESLKNIEDKKKKCKLQSNKLSSKTNKSTLDFIENIRSFEKMLLGAKEEFNIDIEINLLKMRGLDFMND